MPETISSIAALRKHLRAATATAFVDTVDFVTLLTRMNCTAEGAQIELGVLGARSFVCNLQVRCRRSLRKYIKNLVQGIKPTVMSLDIDLNKTSSATLQINNDGSWCCKNGDDDCAPQGSSINATATLAMTSASCPTPAPATDVSQPSSSSSHIATIAASITVPLGLLSITSFSLLLWQCRKNKQHDNNRRRRSLDKSVLKVSRDIQELDQPFNNGFVPKAELDAGIVSTHEPSPLSHELAPLTPVS